MPFCNTPKKIPIFIINFTVFPNNYVFYFCANYVGFFGLCLGQNFFTEKTGKRRKNLHPPSPPNPQPLYFLSHLLSYLSLLYPLFFFSFSTYNYKPLSLLPVYQFISITAYLFSCFPSLSAPSNAHPRVITN